MEQLAAYHDYFKAKYLDDIPRKHSVLEQGINTEFH